MTFKPTQITELEAKLDKSNVKKNPKGFDYVEGWHAIAEANRIFGFAEWDRTTVQLQQLGEPYKNDKGNNVINYMAKVRIVVRADSETVTREGCGFGSGISKDMGQAHESAIKEAETDAMKRAMMTFGNPFGLALYDKTQANVETAKPAPATRRELAENLKAYIDATTTLDALNLVMVDAEDDLKAIKTDSATAFQFLVDRAEKRRHWFANQP